MSRFISKSVFGVLFTSAFLFFSANAFADISEQAQEFLDKPGVTCAKEVAPIVKNFMKNELKNARNACKDLRDCKKAARAQKKECKNGCSGLKGKAKRQCKKQCRKDKRSAKRSCREVYKTPACKSARKKMIGASFKAILKAAKSPECRKAIEGLKNLK